MAYHLLLALLACDGPDDSINEDQETDTDTDTDTDADADADSDSDADADADADTDTGATSTGDTGAACTPRTTFPADDGAAAFVLTGSQEAEAGWAMAALDLDGDGADELVVGGPRAEAASGLHQGGRVWILHGPPTASGDLDTVATEWIDGEESGDWLGGWVSDLGDVDGDGLADLGLVAENCCDSNPRGKAYLSFGSTTRPTGGTSATTLEPYVQGPPTYMGEGLSGIGDLDGDGLGELVFTSPSSDSFAGRLYVLPGGQVPASGEIAEETLPQIMGQTNEGLCRGHCVADADFDGDGLLDLAIGARGSTSGRIYLRYGDGSLPAGESTTTLPSLEHAGDIDFGHATVPAGDLDGDGYPDLAVGHMANDDAAVNAGRAWVVAGGSTRWAGTTPISSQAWLTIEGVQTSGGVGSAMLGLGDLDCDGRDDLAVAAAYHDGLQPSSGAVGLWLSPAGGVDRMSDATAVIEGGIGGQAFGHALAAGDFDGNGEQDLAVGAPGYGADDGRVYVFMNAF